MVPKKCKFSVAMRKNIFLHNSILSYREIGKKLHWNFLNVRYLIKKRKETGSTINKPQTGHPRKLDTRQRRTIVKESSKNLFLNWRELAVDVASTKTIITSQTIRNIFYDGNILERGSWKKLVTQIKWKDLNLQKLRSADLCCFSKTLFLPMNSNSIILAQMARKLCDESQIIQITISN